MEDMSKYKKIFVTEAKEHLQDLNTYLLKLEKSPTDKKGIDEIFRAAHTLKSMSAAMGYNKMSLLAHTMEDVLDEVKKNKRKLSPELIDILFKCFDTLELGVKKVNKDEEEPAVNSLVTKLKNILSTKPTKEKANVGKSIIKKKQVEAGHRKPSKASKTKEKKLEDPKKVKKSKETEEAIEVAEGIELAKRPEAIEKVETVKVTVKRLDVLMNLVEELLVNKMRLDNISDKQKLDELPVALDALARLVSDMQYNIMQARMVPVGQVFNRFPRMIRDLAKAGKKEVELVMEGSDMELDRSTLDQLGEPVVHLLRNAVDHGIELPGERKKSKKSAAGTIKLTALREKGYAIIEVEDDGAGLDWKTIKETAVRKGLLTSAATQEQVVNVLFNPKFSVSKKITTTSGRGVGLDIVRNKIDNLGGTVRVESELGKRTKFRLELPLTLAIIKALLIKVGEEIYAIPLTSVVRSARVKKEQIKGLLEHEVAVLPNEQVPLIRLHELFKIPETVNQPISQPEEESKES
jgi:two-component system, chemotaxis family, sensor kinase CheA